MNEKDSVKALEVQAENTKYLMDKLNRAAYGITHEELIRLLAVRELPEGNGEEK